MNPIADIVAGLAAPVKDLLSEFIEDKDKAAEIAYKVSTMAAEHAHAETMAQNEVNKTEAAHASIFVAGWRPAMGWTCVSAYFMYFVGFPLLVFCAGLFGATIAVPVIKIGALDAVLWGMLGLGGLRTIETVTGNARTSIGKPSKK